MFGDGEISLLVR